MPKIKLCGFKEKSDIDLADELGADFVGLVFYEKSPRNISPKKAKEITKNLKNAQKVAVTVNPTIDFLSEIIDNIHPDFLQIHQGSKSQIQEIKQHFQLPIIKALAISDSDDLKQIADFKDVVEYFLFDTKSLEIGGSGKKFNWDIIKNLSDKNFFLSGGINIDNLEEAIKTGAQFFDLSSGIEINRGVKSPKKIREIMNLWNRVNSAKRF